MKFVALAVLANLANYVLVMIAVGRARQTYGIKAPATTGAPEFERALRIQQNSLEQLIIFLPALWLFATYMDAVIGAGLGVVYLIARILYQQTYSRGANRAPGFILGFLTNIVLLGGALAGVVLNFSALA